jgi:putative methyltransferase (TIGR04325 family)
MLHVADFGGAIGRYRAYVDAMFSGALDLRWTVIETPLYVDHGRATNPPNMAFEYALDDVKEPVNFVLFSSVLQYLPSWKTVLDHPAVRNAENIFITRTPLGPEERPFLQTVTYESGIVRLAARVIPQADLFAHLGASHALFTSFSLDNHLGDPMGIFAAPAMLWTRQGRP